ncbi:hypothetical protein [Aestuariivirga sp.]|uniref:hypothetical protein n=1 Tax=Aestuariivirga sp. TaxID=2650926 RepID=UPI003593301F
MTGRLDWLLLAVAHRRGEALSPVQIQKAMFLMRQEAAAIVGDDFYHFVPYNYGPFDSDIYRDLDSLTERGLIAKLNVPNRSWQYFAATPIGMDAAEGVKKAVGATGSDFLGRVVDWVSSQPFPELLKAIYSKYPEFRKNSVFVG